MAIDSANSHETENYTHIGWVPCVSGHLDFGLASVGLAGNPLRDENKAFSDSSCLNFSHTDKRGSHHRRICIQSWVNWKDRLSGDGKYRVILVGDCEKSRNLDNRSFSGKIYFYPKAYEKDKAYRSSCKSLIGTIKKATETYDGFRQLPYEERDFSWESTQANLNKQFDEICKESLTDPVLNNAPEFFCVEFHALPSGITYLKYNELANDNEESIDESSKYILIRQAFIYLKYSLHKHNHHNREADGLTYPVTLNAEENTSALQLIGQLKRELTRVKRYQRFSRNRTEDSEALGIVGYMQALLNSCMDQKLLNQDTFVRERRYLIGIRQSFFAQKDSIESIRTRYQYQAQWQQWLATIITAFTSLSLLLWVSANKLDSSTTNDLTHSNKAIWEFLTGPIHLYALGMFLLFILIVGISKFWAYFITNINQRVVTLSWLYRLGKTLRTLVLLILLSITISLSAYTGYMLAARLFGIG